MYKMLEIEYDGAVATLWMNRPEVHNAFNAELIAELTAACRQLSDNDAVRVVILGGRGKSFSAGADLNWMKAAGAATEAENFTDAKKLATMLRTLAELPKPTIARVHGAAFAGGMGLAAACDICVASDNASFATTEVRVGIIPSTIGPYVMRAIGARQAYRYFLTAERMSSQRALELGLVHERIESTQLDVTIKRICDALLLGGPKALSASKDLIRFLQSQPLDDGMIDATAQRIAAVRATPEAKEGLDAFLAKRKPDWLPNNP